MREILEISYDEFEDDLNRKLYLQNIKNINGKSKEELEKHNYYAHLIFPPNINFIRKIKQDDEVLKKICNLLSYIFSLNDFSLSFKPLNMSYIGEGKFNYESVNKVMLSYLFPFLDEIGLKNIGNLIKSKI